MKLSILKISIILLFSITAVAKSACESAGKTSLMDVAKAIKAGCEDSLPTKEIFEGELKEGQKINTSAGEKVVIKSKYSFFTLMPNTEVIYSEASGGECDAVFLLYKGQITSESYPGKEHIDQTQCPDNIETSNAYVKPTGTKYSVSMNEVLAEMNGETILPEEEYKVEKGQIQIKLKKVRAKPSYRKVAGKGSKKRTVIAEADTKKVILKKGQKARVKRNAKTQVADLIIVNPGD